MLFPAHSSLTTELKAVYLGSGGATSAITFNARIFAAFCLFTPDSERGFFALTAFLLPNTAFFALFAFVFLLPLALLFDLVFLPGAAFFAEGLLGGAPATAGACAGVAAYCLRATWHIKDPI